MTLYSQFVELWAKWGSLAKRWMGATSWYRIMVACGVASMLVAIIAGTGKAAEISFTALPFEAISERVLWDFGAASDDDGVGPQAGLIADKSGNLYGTTRIGGANGDGTVFELSPPAGRSTQWSESVLYSFGAASDDGAQPGGGLIADKRGNFYSTTSNGGANADGTVFELSPPTGESTQWSESILYSFGATDDDGTNPLAGLLADQAGNLYSTTFMGGANSDGTVFELRPPTGKSTQWSESVLLSFSGDDGAYPVASLIADTLGNLYSTTLLGGANFAGAVFELSPPPGKSNQWSESVLHSFSSPGSGDGFFPLSDLIVDQWGNLYGTTSYGGLTTAQGGNGAGTVFELSPRLAF